MHSSETVDSDATHPIRVAVISDVHGNLPAFEAVLADIHRQGVDARWCLGDLVGYGPQPNECIEAISRYPHLGIPGNHDWGMLGRLSLEEFNADARTVLDWTRKVITAANYDYLESLPLSVTPGERHRAHGGHKHNGCPATHPH